MIADDPQFELGDKIKEVTAHETRRHLVAAGHAFDFGFIPSPPLLGLLGNDKTIAVQLGNVGRMALGRGGNERPDISDGDVVAKDSGHGVGHGGLAVGAGAPSKYKLMFSGQAS